MRISDWSSDVCSSDLPEQDGLVGALAARLLPGHDLAELAVQRRLRQLARLDVGAQRAQLAALALAPFVDHQLVHRHGQRPLHLAHRALRDHYAAGPYPAGLLMRTRVFPAGCLALDFRAP